MKKGKRAISLLLVMIIAMSEVTFVSFAENSDAVTNNEKGQEQTAINDAPKLSESEAVKKYGYYKGKNTGKIPVLTYHKVVSDKTKKEKKYKHSSLAVSESIFDKQMRYLKKKGYRTINCEEFYLWHKGKIKLPEKTVMITFDDGHKGVIKYALPILDKYQMKGTVFIIGKRTRKGKKGTISFAEWKALKDSQDALEFQSHTYNLHKHYSARGVYKRVKKDAAKQKEVYGFEYLAYPYGWNTKKMRKAYADSGIKLAFTYGSNGYATRKQNIYKIRRIKVNGVGTFRQFKKWVR